MIRIESLLKNFGSKCAVDIPAYTVPSGRLLGLVGNNGAGKSTLFRLMLDLLKADRGNVWIDSTDVSRSEDWKTFVGAFIDESFLIDYLTPEEFFSFVGHVHGLSSEEVTERLAGFERLMNGEIMNQQKYIRNFSAGNKQKIGIIAAMLHRPRLLILDEPFNFLDPSSQTAVKHLLKQYNQEFGATVIVSSHNLNHTIDLCSHIALMEQGHILHDLDNKDASAKQLLESYFDAPESTAPSKEEQNMPTED